MIKSVLDGDLGIFRTIPFRRFLMKLSNGYSVTLTPTLPDADSQDSASLHARIEEPEGVTEHDLQDRTPQDAARYVSENLAPHWQYFGGDRWIDGTDNEVVSSATLASRFAIHLPDELQKIESYPPALADLRSRTRVHFIRTERLTSYTQQDPDRIQWTSRLRVRHPSARSTVRQNAVELKSHVDQTMAEYGRRSQTLDQSFPKRLLQTAEVVDEDPKGIGERMKTISRTRENLVLLGLLDEAEAGADLEPGMIDRLEEARRDVMVLYVKDTEEKLGVLSDLAERVGLLINNVNQKFKHKQVRVDREKGLVVEGDGGQRLELDDLSSGEQHELVLHFELLFNVRQNALVLIDEPEISLHVSWQKQFLSDLIAMAGAVEFDALIATHSPYIVGDRSSLLVQLGTVD
jgi:hypothetical protein